jgi:hypothetical protein
LFKNFKGLENEENVILVLFRHALETIHTMHHYYQAIQQIIRGCFRVQSTISVQYLLFCYRKSNKKIPNPEKIVTNPDKPFLEEYTKIMDESEISSQISTDLTRLYSVLSQKQFNELLLKVKFDFENK